VEPTEQPIVTLSLTVSLEDMEQLASGLLRERMANSDNPIAVAQSCNLSMRLLRAFNAASFAAGAAKRNPNQGN
jgi:hypothetical protein